MRKAMIDRNHKLPVKRQCELLGVARSTAYYRPEAVSQGDQRRCAASMNCT